MGGVKPKQNLFVFLHLPLIYFEEDDNIEDGNEHLIGSDGSKDD